MRNPSIRWRTRRHRLGSVMSTVFSPANAHLATTGPANSPSTLEGTARRQGRDLRATLLRRAAPGTPDGDNPRPGTTVQALWRDPFRRQRARHGRRAGFRWWHRLGAGAALLLLIGVLGVLLAALVGLGAFIGGIALEAIIG